jgi:hypothetical protein
MQTRPPKYQDRLSPQPEKTVLDPLEHDPLDHDSLDHDSLDHEDEPAVPAILLRKAAMRKTVYLWKTIAM